MCQWGTSTLVDVTVPAGLSHTGQSRRKQIGVDSCIAPVVAALNAGGLATVCSCCGHGRVPGCITLADGRELVIMPSFEAARAYFDRFPTTICGEPNPPKLSYEQSMAIVLKELARPSPSRWTRMKRGADGQSDRQRE